MNGLVVNLIKINRWCPICNGYIDMEHDKFINSFGQLFHTPKCWKVETSKLRAEYGV